LCPTKNFDPAAKESFLETRKVEGPVLGSTLPNAFSPWFLAGFTDAEGNFDIQIF
jgi:hypothetical protein